MNDIKSKPSKMLVSVDTYSAIIINKSPIVDYLKALNLYFSIEIRSITNIEDNYVLTYDNDGHFLGKVKFYEI